ncbi:MAG: ribosomal protein S6--L-glutamate ligase, partial [Paracoccaceae bacterium]
NSSPGLEGIEAATQKNIASEIINYIEKDILKGPNKVTGKG